MSSRCQAGNWSGLTSMSDLPDWDTVKSLELAALLTRNVRPAGIAAAVRS